MKISKACLSFVLFAVALAAPTPNASRGTSALGRRAGGAAAENPNALLNGVVEALEPFTKGLGVTANQLLFGAGAGTGGAAGTGGGTSGGAAGTGGGAPGGATNTAGGAASGNPNALLNGIVEALKPITKALGITLDQLLFGISEADSASGSGTTGGAGNAGGAGTAGGAGNAGGAGTTGGTGNADGAGTPGGATSAAGGAASGNPNALLNGVVEALRPIAKALGITLNQLLFGISEAGNA